MKKLLIIGGGNMGFAIASGIFTVTKNAFRKQEIIIIEQDLKRIKFLKTQKYIAQKSIPTKVNKYTAVILAVKPQDIQEVLSTLKNKIARDTLVISIAAGIKINKISSMLNKNQPIVRAMPNTPCQIGKGISALTFNKFVSKNQKIIAYKIFKSIGSVIEAKENSFDLITALSGSGPAYFCFLTESLIKAGIKEGISKDIASKLVIETGLGTMALLLTKKISPEALRKYVTSPKGTTKAALKVFQKKNFENIVKEAIKSARRRSQELSKL